MWIYSIAPFMYARPFEQIRNDICFHHLPVKLIGNGGGYGYGVMGPTHHAIDDYGALLTLPGMTRSSPRSTRTSKRSLRGPVLAWPGLPPHGPRRAAPRMDGSSIPTVARTDNRRRSDRGRGRPGRRYVHRVLRRHAG